MIWVLTGWLIRSIINCVSGKSWNNESNKQTTEMKTRQLIKWKGRNVLRAIWLSTMQESIVGLIEIEGKKSSQSGMVTLSISATYKATNS